jgi:c-di-GMP-related signal transduction protein
MLVEILGFANDLSVALQKRDQYLMNILSLVNATKHELQETRDDGWKELISMVIKKSISMILMHPIWMNRMCSG